MAKKASTISNVKNDEVAQGVQETLDFLRRNALALAGVAVLALVVVLAREAIVRSHEKAASAVNMAIVQGLRNLNAIMAGADSVERLQQAKALADNLDAVVAQYPGVPLANQALYIKGRALFEADQYEEAQKAYRLFIDKSSDAEMIARGELALGYTYENQSFAIEDAKRQAELLGQALQAYEKAAAPGQQSYIHGYAIMAQARVHELLHQNDKAIALYRQVVNDRPLPYAQVLDARNAKNEAQASVSEQYKFFRENIDQGEVQIGFKQTAQLRLDRLTQAAAVKPKQASPVAATPAGTPAAAGAATTAP
jgi:tetratricopeptide (TPR) repeat protein